MESTAKHDFNATAEDELSFRKNQILKVNIFLFMMGKNMLVFCAYLICIDFEEVFF
jgi:SH3 domain